MSLSENSNDLCASSGYRVAQRFDMAFLIWPDGELYVGDHCHTDPQCAVINAENGWCVSGGQGLEICLFEDGLPRGPNVPDPARMKRLSLWRHENPPPDGERYWFVVKIWHYHEDRVRVLVNPLGPAAGLYEVDVRTLQWERL